MILETLPALNALTVDQKLRLVWELWHDVSHQQIDTPSIAPLLHARLEAHEANPEDTKSTADVTAGILALKLKLAAARG
jgi:putative addiction module component (TIGR02574 family)